MPAPDTIVLIHGFWVTPRSWENWIAHYERFWDDRLSRLQALLTKGDKK